MIQAITFDLWDTVIQDDSDEPLRLQRGLRSKYDERRYLIWELASSIQPTSFEKATFAYDAIDIAFNKVWHDQHVTWTVAERLGLIAKALGIEFPKDKLSATIKKLEVMEVDVPPTPVDGVEDVLDQLSSSYKLAVISDTIVSPGRELRNWLEKHGLLQFFCGFAFSDEVGRSKPHPRIFESAASQLNVDLDRIVHIGDREHNDIKGAHAMNMRAILFTGSRKTDLPNNTADAVCEDYRELPSILRSLEN